MSRLMREDFFESSQKIQYKESHLHLGGSITMQFPRQNNVSS